MYNEVFVISLSFLPKKEIRWSIGETGAPWDGKIQTPKHRFDFQNEIFWRHIWIQHPVGYVWTRDENYQKCVTLHFLTKQIFKKVSQCTPYSGTLRHHMGYLETPNYVLENSVDLTKIKIWILHIPVAKACSWLMLDVAVKYVPEKKWGHLETLSGHLETDLGHLETVWGHIETASQGAPPWLTTHLIS